MLFRLQFLIVMFLGEALDDSDEDDDEESFEQYEKRKEELEDEINALEKKYFKGFLLFLLEFVCPLKLIFSATRGR